MNYLIRKPGATLGRGQPQSQWSATQSLWVYKDSLVLSFTCTYLSLLLSYPRLYSPSSSSSPLVYLGSGHRLLVTTILALGLLGLATRLDSLRYWDLVDALSLSSFAVAFVLSLYLLSVTSLFLRLLGSWPHLLQHVSRSTSTSSSLQVSVPTCCHRPSTLLRAWTVLWLG